MILREGHPTLKAVCRPFDFATDDAQALYERMGSAMLAERGLGLAAPQIGEPVRAFVLADPRGPIFMANPVLKAGQDGQTRVLEGCLSYPGVFVYTRRWRTVAAHWQGLDGEWVGRLLNGPAAHAFQHELDHLDGRTLPDMVPAQAWANAKAAAKLKAA